MSLAIVLASALAAASVGEGDSAQLVAEVKSADAAWAEAAAAKSVERMLDFYDEAAVFIAQDGRVISGREGLRAAWTAFFGTPGIELSWQAHVVGGSQSRDLAFSYGSWEIEQGPSGQTTKRTGTYVFVWKKQADGKWKVLVDKP
jgi:ketosteroid isomerase-like protein